MHARAFFRLSAVIAAAFFISLSGCEVEFEGFDFDVPAPWSGPSEPEQEFPCVNLPRELREWNWGGGSCVHASTVMQFRWTNMLDLAKWWRETYAGGESYNGLTSKLQRAQINYYSTASGEVEVLERCHRERRGAVIFYYPNHSILLVHFDHERAIVLDNNRIDAFIEIPRETFVKNWRGYGGVAIVPEIGAPAPPLPFVRKTI